MHPTIDLASAKCRPPTRVVLCMHATTNIYIGHAFVFARLRFPCSRCVHLLCVPLLCVPALCAFVWCVVCLCSARLHRAALVDVADTTPLVDPGDLTCPSGDLTHAPVP